jgi:hypothetical protein
MELEFSRAVYHPDCRVAYLFELIGEAPALIPVIYLGFLLAVAVFNRKWFKENKKEQTIVFLYVTLTATIKLFQRVKTEMRHDIKIIT